eukprot:5836944-Amphidinium_carterae.1
MILPQVHLRSYGTLLQLLLPLSAKVHRTFHDSMQRLNALPKLPEDVRQTESTSLTISMDVNHCHCQKTSSNSEQGYGTKCTGLWAL